MLCPMKFSNDTFGSKFSINCEEEECAFWVKYRGRCAVLELSVQFRIFADSFLEDCLTEREEMKGELE